MLTSAESGTGYAVDIQFGSATFTVLFDTGSSDLWLPAADFQCVNENHAAQPLSACKFDQTVSGGFSDGEIADQNFNITYGKPWIPFTACDQNLTKPKPGDGEFLTGKLGYETVSLAGVTVAKQEVALVDYGYWNGDSQTDGLMGFAYPSLTSAFAGTDSHADNSNANAANYSPFFFNAVQQGLIDGVFTMILARTEGGSSSSSAGAGQLILGSAPTTAADGSQLNFATTPLRAVQLNSIQKTASQFSYYTIIPDGFSLGPPGTSSSGNSSSEGSGKTSTPPSGPTSTNTTSSASSTSTGTTTTAAAAAPSSTQESGTIDHFGDTARQQVDAAVTALLSLFHLVAPGPPAAAAAGSTNNSNSSTAPNTKLTTSSSSSSTANFTTAQTPVIVDSGTTLTYLPPSLVRPLAAAFSPPATYNGATGVWETACDAAIPFYSIRIAGTDFPFDSRDLLLTDAVGKDEATGKCLLGIQGGGEKGPYILGDTFLRGKVVVFDVGNSQMRFAEAGTGSAA